MFSVCWVVQLSFTVAEGKAGAAGPMEQGVAGGPAMALERTRPVQPGLGSMARTLSSPVWVTLVDYLRAGKERPCLPVIAKRPWLFRISQE